GWLLLRGRGGTRSLRLSGFTMKPRGANGVIKSQMVVTHATGSYAKVDGSAGSFVDTIQDLENWHKRAKKLMTNKADINSLSSAAYFLLESTDPPPVTPIKK